MSDLDPPLSTPAAPDSPETLSALVAAVPGVVSVYPARSTTERLLRLRPGTSSSDELVIVEYNDDATVVRVHIAVDEGEPAPEVSRRVSAALRSHLVTTAGSRPVHVRVKVGRIG